MIAVAPGRQGPAVDVTVRFPRTGRPAGDHRPRAPRLRPRRRPDGDRRAPVGRPGAGAAGRRAAGPARAGRLGRLRAGGARDPRPADHRAGGDRLAGKLVAPTASRCRRPRRARPDPSVSQARARWPAPTCRACGMPGRARRADRRWPRRSSPIRRCSARRQPRGGDRDAARPAGHRRMDGAVHRHARNCASPTPSPPPTSA